MWIEGRGSRGRRAGGYGRAATIQCLRSRHFATWPPFGLTNEAHAHTLRWASEFAQRENCHHAVSADLRDAGVRKCCGDNSKIRLLAGPNHADYRCMNSIMCTYPGFQALPRGIKQMLVESETEFFSAVKPPVANCVLGKLGQRQAPLNRVPVKARDWAGEFVDGWHN